MHPPRQNYKNRILAALPSAEIDRLAPHLSAVSLKISQPLSNGKATHAYFVEQGLASAVVSLGDGRTVEVCVIGLDGIVGISILLGSPASPAETVVQLAGSALKIDGEILKQEFERQGELRQRLQRYLQGYLVQTAQTAACNRLHDIEERLARWLLTCRDRVDTDQLQLTHEFLGIMLGAPRTTVTLAAGLLHRAGLIDLSRGLVVIKDRAGLEKTACECYRTVRQEFRRLGLL